jgi:hypothetical protein
MREDASYFFSAFGGQTTGSWVLIVVPNVLGNSLKPDKGAGSVNDVGGIVRYSRCLL